jgi:hypothetical protein
METQQLVAVLRAVGAVTGMDFSSELGRTPSELYNIVIKTLASKTTKTTLQLREAYTTGSETDTTGDLNTSINRHVNTLLASAYQARLRLVSVRALAEELLPVAENEMEKTGGDNQTNVYTARTQLFTHLEDVESNLFDATLTATTISDTIITHRT